MGHGLVVHEAIIFAAGRGVSTIATSWWMDLKTSRPRSVTPLTRDAGCVYFVACDSHAEALRLQAIMVTTGKLPSEAVRLRFGKLDGTSWIKSRDDSRQIHRARPDL